MSVDIVIVTSAEVIRADQRYTHPVDGGPHSGEHYGKSDFLKADKLTQIGAVPWGGDDPAPSSQVATAWTVEMRDGKGWRVPTAWTPAPRSTPDTSKYISLAAQSDREEAIAATNALIDVMDDGAAKTALRNILTLIGG